jgi:hypothetical protein
MLFNRFAAACEKFLERPALNDLTYHELYDLVTTRPYVPVSTASDYTVILDILTAAYYDLPIVVLPKFGREDLQISNVESNEFCLYLFSSGTTGPRKTLKLTDSMLEANADNAITAQSITHEDKIYTVCSLNHTGGINAQTIPGLLSGAHIITSSFNPFGFMKELNELGITLTHLIPIMIDSLIKVDSSIRPANLKLVVAGSDCVNKEHVSFWTDRGYEFMSNYGLTEAGPIIINHLFFPGSDMSIFEHGVPLGTMAWCDTGLIDGELILLGSCVSKEDWFYTGDCVTKQGPWYMYHGRKEAGCKILPKKY